jgi:hypothetical protein
MLDIVDHLVHRLEEVGSRQYQSQPFWFVFDDGISAVDLHSHPVLHRHQAAGLWEARLGRRPAMLRVWRPTIRASSSANLISGCSGTAR